MALAISLRTPPRILFRQHFSTGTMVTQVPYMDCREPATKGGIILIRLVGGESTVGFGRQGLYPPSALYSLLRFSLAYEFLV